MERSSALELARALALGRGHQLLADARAVVRPLDRAEDADRRRRVVVGRQAGQRGRQAGVVAPCVVDEDGVLTDVGDLDDAQLAVAAHDDAAVAVGPEADRAGRRAAG